MAQRVVTQLIDDLDGTELDEGQGETVVFALDGTSYEIDLSHQNAGALRGALANYVGSGRRVGRRAGSGSRRTASGPSAAEIREWARSSGHAVPDRGRIPTEVREAYDAR